jgi:sarcosine oxidase
MSDYVNSLQVCDVPFETITAAEVMRRWPQFRLPDDTLGLYQADGGIAPAAKCNAAHIRMARAYGATLLDNTPIRSIRTGAGEIEIVAGDQTYRTDKLIIAAGAWTNQALAGFGLKLPLTITQEQVTYFASPHQASFAPERFPIWIWMDDPAYYGFPIYGEAGVKVAQDVGGEEVTAETRSFEPNQTNLQRVKTFLEQHLPGVLGPILYTKTCLYTLTPDRDFVIDTLPEQPNVAVAIGAGHAFKFASIIGKILGELVSGGSTASDLSLFQIDRPILRQENPVKSFMV